MIFSSSALGTFTLLCIFCLTEVTCNKVCYRARICIHNAREQCGVDTGGTFRRFLDSCDLQEYNCLKGTEYIKTKFEKCNNLPPLEHKEKSKTGVDAI